MLNAKQARALGERIATHLARHETEAAYAKLAPLLRQRIPFSNLDRVAREWDCVSLSTLDDFLLHLVQSDTIGSGPLLGTALAVHVDDDLSGALDRERQYAVLANVWYTVDAMGERAAGTALVTHFDATLNCLGSWRRDENRWVRRSIGVGIHVWAKRTRGQETAHAKQLLRFLEPMWGEAELDAVKGIGWGLKTIGRYHPALMREWLRRMEPRPHRALMMKKARTYL